MEFTHELCFTHVVPHDLPSERPADVDKVETWFFASSFPEQEVPVYYKQSLMRAIFGLGYNELVFETGPGYNGKSARASAVRRAFGGYVKDLDGSHVSVEPHARPGAPSPQAMVFEHARIVYVSEPPPNMVLDVALLKRLTGGDPIAGRQLNKPIVQFESRAKVWFLVNNIPKFSECEESFMLRRLRQMDSNVQWLRDDEHDRLMTTTRRTEEELARDLIFKADENLSRECIDAPEALIWLLVHEPLRKVAPPPSVLVASRETVTERDDNKVAFTDNFEWTKDPSDKVSSKEIMERLGVKQPKELAKYMKAWGYGQPKGLRVGEETCQGYQGVKRKREQRD